MIELQTMPTHEAEVMWEEFCYHNALCDIVEMMKRYGEGKVIMDILSMPLVRGRNYKWLRI